MSRQVLRRIDDEKDGMVALPPVNLVRQRLRKTVKVFAVSQPGRRAAALTAPALPGGCAPPVADWPRKQEREYLDDLEKRFQKKIEVAGARDLAPEAFRVDGKIVAPTGDDDGAPKKKGRGRRGGRGRGRKSDGKAAADGA